MLLNFDELLMENALINYNNYYVYADTIKNRLQLHEVYVPEQITIHTIYDHIDGIRAILKDGIETDYIHGIRIRVSWPTKSGPRVYCKLNIVDYWISMFMWKLILECGDRIKPQHIFLGSRDAISNNAIKANMIFPWHIRRKDIANYINRHILSIENKMKIGNARLNEMIADALHQFSLFEDFAYYLSNTINNEDDIAMMKSLDRFRAIKHISLANVPIEDIKDKGMEYTNEIIGYIKDAKYYLGHDHALTQSFESKEAVNPRQYKESAINIGTKPDGEGGIFPYTIDKSFSTGGVNDPLSCFVESHAGRTAQKFSKVNVGDSGDFARLLGLNNTDTILCNNPQCECMSQNFVKIQLKSEKHVSMFKNRTYRTNPRGIDYHLNGSDKSMVGKTIYLHSPMTCASNSSGNGICRKCYGDLYYTNYNINVGKIAAEILSAQLTQTLLSAKHLLETKITAIVWNPEFKDFFDIDINCIKLSEEILDDDNLKKFTMIIDPEDVQLVNEEEDTIYDESEDEFVADDSGVYNEYITSFIIRTPEGYNITMSSESGNELYISTELSRIIQRKASNTDGKVNIPLSALGNNNLFYVKIANNEISKVMNDIINCIDKSSVTEKFDKDTALQSITDLIVDGNLTIDGIHLEVIFSNQIVSTGDVLKKPNWNEINPAYRMITLNQALTNNPSVIISLLYKDLHKVLYSPLTFTKNAPSFFDLFFHEKPQAYMNNDLYTDITAKSIVDVDKSVQMYSLNANAGNKESELFRRLDEEMIKEAVKK